MASATRKLKVRRALSKAKAGSQRKKHVKINGSTAPSLPLNMPNAHEKAVKAAKQSS